ncbi:hypothetical protein PF008_g12579 [Phytophthora fragariae]|uniref:Uncharacterized protein n=1 Tax=Phytophthora fragariae TaxID=53985 RepID=A0A6G0RNZ3_9STRA|nr:hypothetical protein PF008_g12579 [Phytophthora fragariae]
MLTAYPSAIVVFTRVAITHAIHAEPEPRCLLFIFGLADYPLVQDASRQLNAGMLVETDACLGVRDTLLYRLWCCKIHVEVDGGVYHDLLWLLRIDTARSMACLLSAATY